MFTSGALKSKAFLLKACRRRRYERHSFSSSTKPSDPYTEMKIISVKADVKSVKI